MNTRDIRLWYLMLDLWTLCKKFKTPADRKNVQTKTTRKNSVNPFRHISFLASEIFSICFQWFFFFVCQKFQMVERFLNFASSFLVPLTWIIVWILSWWCLELIIFFCFCDGKSLRAEVFKTIQLVVRI